MNNDPAAAFTHPMDLAARQRLNIEIGRLRQRESMLEAQIEVLELTIGKLRCVCDAAFTFVRWEGEEDSLTPWQETSQRPGGHRLSACGQRP